MLVMEPEHRVILDRKVQKEDAFAAQVIVWHFGGYGKVGAIHCQSRSACRESVNHNVCTFQGFFVAGGRRDAFSTFRIHFERHPGKMGQCIRVIGWEKWHLAEDPAGFHVMG